MWKMIDLKRLLNCQTSGGQRSSETRNYHLCNSRVNRAGYLQSRIVPRCPTTAILRDWIARHLPSIESFATIS
jgi:hypothetical protein